MAHFLRGGKGNESSERNERCSILEVFGSINLNKRGLICCLCYPNATIIAKLLISSHFQPMLWFSVSDLQQLSDQPLSISI